MAVVEKFAGKMKIKMSELATIIAITFFKIDITLFIFAK